MSSQASTSTTSIIPSVFTWSSAQERDLEAQTISGTHEHFNVQLPTPPAARLHAPRTRPSNAEEGTNAVDDFFGASSSRRSPRGTQDSRHDTMSLPVHHDDSGSDAPPPYSYSSEPPAYTRYVEHPTLAMYLFKFGFLFPLFWIAGALVLISPLRAPQDWELSKTDAERQELIESMRRTEIKWARRCLIAIFALALVVLAVVLAAVFLMRT
ncbi:uncharacterized protein C8Q71DRAFT_724628 [Rhodofomes roseus]|uniref:Uncharacterized protein n=1 Tax=Rhodofomes roseus TaxID=34475 RepID=A0ABQ8KDQ9_9APHY|nr:uncharacterized protein C8Q71DRAFT_724628 [Rhodofomes roseus]KAH9835293.1 hypothetical protein C8Q71DRAFT_724628 [Rhodofomes roseus]